VHYLASNPTERHRPAEILVLDSLRQAFPCSN
jgi:hypothetical protein